MSDFELRVRALDPAARRALRGWLADAERAGIDIDDLDSIQCAYEDHFDRVQAAAAADREDPTPVLTMIGIAMGDHVRRRSSVIWQIAADDDGADLALIGSDGAGVFFPADAVADQWNAGQRGWLAEFTEQVVAQLNPPPG